MKTNPGSIDRKALRVSLFMDNLWRESIEMLASLEIYKGTKYLVDDLLTIDDVNDKTHYVSGFSIS